MQERNTYPFSSGRPKKFSYYKITLLVLALIIWLLSSFALTYMTLWIDAKHSQPSYLNKLDKALVIYATATVQPTPTATATPVPTPVPITPFPTTLAQQIAALQAKDRFFYGGNPNLPEIALTFDDGPNPPYTLQILTILQHYGIKATFFCVGSRVQSFPAVVKQEYSDGNMVENHSWSHPNMNTLPADSVIWQLSTTQNIIQHTIGVRPIFFRPPYGLFNSTVLTDANYFGLTTFLWNVDPRDWSMPGVNAIYTQVLAQTRAGSIILLHDGGGDRSQTVAALPLIIEWFQSHHFQFVTLQQLVNDAHKVPPTPTPTKIAREG